MITAKFNKPENGTSYDREHNKKYLKENCEYEISIIEMGQYYTSIELKDFPNISFNSVNFDFYENGKEIDIYEDARFNPYIEAERILKSKGSNMSKEDFEGIKEHAKEQHDKRVADTPNRIAFAIKQFENNNIEYVLKNEKIGHFHCRRKTDDKLFQFYAGTGKIQGVNNKRGIHELIKILLGD